MLCMPVFILTSGSSALLGCPPCDFWSDCSYLSYAIHFSEFNFMQKHFMRKWTKQENTQSWDSLMVTKHTKHWYWERLFNWYNWSDSLARWHKLEIPIDYDSDVSPKFHVILKVDERECSGNSTLKILDHNEVLLHCGECISRFILVVLVFRERHLPR